MGVLSCCRISLAISPEELPAYQVSIISLFVLSLCTFILHFIISTSSQDHEQSQDHEHAPIHTPNSQSIIDSGPRISLLHFNLGFFTIFIWLGAFITWFFALGSVSVILRNNALLYGIIAANGGPFYLLLARKMRDGRIAWSFEGLMGLVLWPLYIGMFLGTLGFGRLE